MAVSINWGRPSGGGFFNFGAKASEPISSRAQDYKSPGDNSSPAGKTIPAGSGTSAYDGQIVWWGDFKVKDGKVTASFAILFKDCLFAPSFSLLKLYADKQLIISNMAPLRQSSQKIRYHDGTQTTPDPLLLAQLGADKVTVWPGLPYAVFEDFDCTPYGNHVPLIRAVLSGAVTNIAASEEQSTLTFGEIGSYETNWLAVDRTRNHAYVFYWADIDDDGFISVVDIASNAEISRAAVRATNYTLLEYMLALDGTDYVIAAVHETSGAAYYDLLLVNAYTGEAVARLEALLSGGDPLEALPRTAVMIENAAATKFVVLCGTIFRGAATQSYLGALLVDVTNGTMEWVIHPYTNPAPGAGEPYAIAIGPVADGAVTIFYAEWASGSFTVRKAVINSSGFTATTFFTEVVSHPSYLGLAYDVTDDGVILYRSSPTVMRKYSVAGALVWTAATPPAALFLNASFGSYSDFRYSARPGFAIAAQQDSTGDVYQIDLADGSVAQLIVKGDFSDEGDFAYFDEFAGVYVEESLSTPGVINKITLGDMTPNAVDLVDILTQLVTYDGRFDASDLVFVGFPGNECSGFNLANDTTIDDTVQSICDAFDIKTVESDGKLKFFWPPRDVSFAVDQELAHQDFVETGTQTAVKTINAGEDEYAGVTFGYYDQDADYQKLEQPFDRPLGVFDVTRSRKRRTIPSLLSMTASQALRAATLAVFRSVLGNQTYAFGLRPGMAHVEPADIVAFDFRGFRTVARISEATFKADYTQDCLAKQYLQYSEATYDGATLTPPQLATIALYARFIWLDTPLLSRAHDLAGTGLVQYAQMTGYGTAALASALLYRSDDGAIFTLISQRSDITPVAGIITAMSGTPTDPFSTDFVNTIHVAIGTGDPASIQSVSAAAFYDGANFAAIGRPGGWVLIHYQDAVVSDGVAQLSTIIWGALGSEVFIARLAPGDLFVPLNPAHYSRFSSAVAGLGDARFYKATTALLPLGAVATEAHVSTGAAEKPYACVNLRAAVDGSDIDLAADARSRLSPFEMFAADPASGEAIDAFEWDIMDGGTVLRTLESADPAVTYPDADIVADFGALPATLTFRLAKMSAVAGRGHLAQATITL